MTEYDVPRDAAPVRCPHCDRPFHSQQLRALHVGEVHPGECSDAEREAFEAARDEEADEMFVFHLKVVGALVIVFMSFAYLWAFVLS